MTEYLYKIVLTESVEECECGDSHEVGDSVFWSKIAPDEFIVYPPMKQMNRMHSGDKEWVEVE